MDKANMSKVVVMLPRFFVISAQFIKFLLHVESFYIFLCYPCPTGCVKCHNIVCPQALVLVLCFHACEVVGVEISYKIHHVVGV